MRHLKTKNQIKSLKNLCRDLSGFEDVVRDKEHVETEVIEQTVLFLDAWEYIRFVLTKKSDQNRMFKKNFSFFYGQREGESKKYTNRKWKRSCTINQAPVLKIKIYGQKFF